MSKVDLIKNKDTEINRKLLNDNKFNRIDANYDLIDDFDISSHRKLLLSAIKNQETQNNADLIRSYMNSGVAHIYERLLYTACLAFEDKDYLDCVLGYSTRPWLKGKDNKPHPMSNVQVLQCILYIHDVKINDNNDYTYVPKVIYTFCQSNNNSKHGPVDNFFNLTELEFRQYFNMVIKIRVDVLESFDVKMADLRN